MAIYVSDENGKLTKYAGGLIDRIKANKDASNLSDKDVMDWQVKLGVLGENLFLAYPSTQTTMDIYVDCTDGNKFSFSGDPDTGMYLTVEFPIEAIPIGTYNISAFGLSSVTSANTITLRLLNSSQEVIYDGLNNGANFETVSNVPLTQEIRYIQFLFDGGDASSIEGEVTVVVTNTNISPTIDMLPAGKILSSGEVMFGFNKPQSGVTYHSYGIRTVVESYLSSDGLTWYRIYSDGWKECGGQAITAASANAQTITLPITFSNANFTVLMNKSGSDSSDAYVNDISVFNVTQSSFQTRGYNSPVRYYACGY